MLIVEDLHWADRDLLSDLAALAAHAQGSPIVLVMTSRFDGDPIDQGWRSAARGASVLTIDLGPLRASDAKALAAGVIDPNSRLAEACVARADGNPLFLLQLLRNATDLDLDAVPDTLQSVVQSRLDRLPAADKRALQAASVIGQRFGTDLLRLVVGDAAYRCDALVANSLVRPDGDEFLFVHALVRDGVYASLLRQTRREAHRLAASWFEQRDPALCAQHLDRGEDERAPAAYVRAAQAAAWHYRFDEALVLAARGLELARSARDRFDLSIQRAEALRALGRTQDSIDVYRDMLGFAAADADRGRAWIGVAAGLRILSRIDEAMQALADADTALAATDLLLEKAQHPLHPRQPAFRARRARTMRRRARKSSGDRAPDRRCAARGQCARRPRRRGLCRRPDEDGARAFPPLQRAVPGARLRTDRGLGALHDRALPALSERDRGGARRA